MSVTSCIFLPLRFAFSHQLSAVSKKELSNAWILQLFALNNEAAASL